MHVRRLGLATASAALAAAGLLGCVSLPAAQAAPARPSVTVSPASGKTMPDGRPLPSSHTSRGAVPATARAAAAGDTLAAPECPLVLMARCHLAPAAYTQVDPADKSNYGNYDLANRPTGGLRDAPGVSLPISQIVIHDTEGSLADTLATFRDPSAYRSSHYVIDTDGSIYQVVPTRDVAWHAGNWYVNEHSIGIEHIGHAAQGGTEYTPAEYQSSALLVHWLATRYHIPLDRSHLLGHDNVPGPTQDFVPGMHTDPGPFWNWQLYQALLGVPVVPSAGFGSPLVTIAPNWPVNQPRVSQCAPDGTACANLPVQPANFVYLHTAPSDTAPLLTDPALHPDGAPGSTRIYDWSAKATYGQQFAVAARQGGWTGIYYGGTNTDGSAKIGWFCNPAGLLTALPARGQYLTPRAGRISIPVYGRAYPEASAYAGRLVPVQAVVPLSYTIGAGQRYSTSGLVRADYYWAWNIDSSFNADDHTTVIGSDRYYQIQFNHRLAFVKAADVQVVNIS